nr:immunoglobulin heavy chain junction region [Mus musculus]
LHISVQERL